MLGNFSFGDYFKAEVIPWAWSFCTNVLEMPEDRLYVSVYEEDDEAYEIWHQSVGLDYSRIYRMGKEDNYWEHRCRSRAARVLKSILTVVPPMAAASRIAMSAVIAIGLSSSGIWFSRSSTVMKMEATRHWKRRTSIREPAWRGWPVFCRNVDNLFEVDTIRAILDHACRLAGVTYGSDQKADMAIARDHRPHPQHTTMMISDGVIPSNEDRGLCVKAAPAPCRTLWTRLLGLERPFLFKLVPTVIQESSGAYPELVTNRDRIIQIISPGRRALHGNHSAGQCDSG